MNEKYLRAMPNGSSAVISKFSGEVEEPRSRDDVIKESRRKSKEKVDLQNTAINKIADMLTDINEVNEMVFKRGPREMEDIANRIIDDLQQLNKLVIQKVEKKNKDAQ